ncbi:hypothetical protein CKO50_14645 [Pseudoalteromonas sp. HM-SA03]|nr:hypothetical protein CKO50_14645 [Pseudoalteromonas sp. HM-SA03]
MNSTISNFEMYFPLLYWYKSRLNLKKLCEWFVYYISLPLIYVYSLDNNLESILVIDFIVYTAFFMFFYEIGYFDNDRLAHKEGKGKKDRLKGKVINVGFFFGIRILLLLPFLMVFYNYYGVDYSFFFGSLSMMIVYYYHNRIKLKNRVYTYYFLSVMRAVVPFVSCFFVSIDFFYLILYFLVFYFLVLQPKVFTYILRKSEMMNSLWLIRYLNVFSAFTIFLCLCFYMLWGPAFICFLFLSKEVYKANKVATSYL